MVSGTVLGQNCFRNKSHFTDCHVQALEWWSVWQWKPGSGIYF